MKRSTDVKSRIERAAVDLFAKRGLDGVSIADIAGQAGVSQGALYRHYQSKDALAWTLFSTAYLRTGAELDRIHAAAGPGLDARIGAMIKHFCTIFDREPALFRFMLIAQHGLLPRLGHESRTPVDAFEDALRAALDAGEIDGVAPPAGAAVIIGIVLQTAVFHIYGRLRGALAPQAPALSRAALAAVRALASTEGARPRPVSS